MDLQKLAEELAINSIASGIDDFGCLYHDEWNLPDEQWNAVCDEAERLLPIVEVPMSRRIEYAEADRAFRAEQAAESRTVYGGEF